MGLSGMRARALFLREAITHISGVGPSRAPYRSRWKRTDYMDLDIYRTPQPHSMPNIVCTIGPASRSVDTIRHMIRAGMRIARLNFSHGEYETHLESIKYIREAAAGTPIAIALDTKGPEIRTGCVDGDLYADVRLETGKMVLVRTDPEYKDKVDENVIWVDYPKMTNILVPGNRIYIDDGNISLIVVSKGNELLECRIEHGGILGSRKGCNLPGITLDLPHVTEGDKKDIEFGLQHGVDIIFASFVRSAKGVMAIREVAQNAGDMAGRMKIIPKIECEDGVRNFKEILNVSDGVMVARGDLGIEIPVQKVFLVQKMIISKCNQAGKPVICATHMLDSMTHNVRPTRAEITDVANAVLDGTDCVMLSSETAKGQYPVESIQMMNKIIMEAQNVTYFQDTFSNPETPLIRSRPAAIPHTVAAAAVQAARDCQAAAIIVVTGQGHSAQLVASYRPKCFIIAVTMDAQAARQILLYRGTYPVLYQSDANAHSEVENEEDWSHTVDQRVTHAVRIARGKHMVHPGDRVIVLAGEKAGSGFTNTMCIAVVPVKENQHLHIMSKH